MELFARYVEECAPIFADGVRHVCTINEREHDRRDGGAGQARRPGASARRSALPRRGRRRMPSSPRTTPR
ncbi:hypothetical protein [Streptomyces sp. KL116D]|uniref:hypothetical protein n=1 Tax=Streptomyces sp. KL116D TaxID=3045152 RepID=UPI003557E6A2